MSCLRDGTLCIALEVLYRRKRGTAPSQSVYDPILMQIHCPAGPFQSFVNLIIYCIIVLIGAF